MRIHSLKQIATDFSATVGHLQNNKNQLLLLEHLHIVVFFI